MADFVVDPTALPPSLQPNFMIRAIRLPGETTPMTAVAGDDASADTLLGNSSFLASGLLPATKVPGSNYMLRMVLDGEFGTLPPLETPRKVLPPNSRAPFRKAGTFVAIDRDGQLIQ